MVAGQSRCDTTDTITIYENIYENIYDYL
jgi:hypothetical protein